MPRRRQNVVPPERLATMKRYNDNMSAETKQQNAMTKLFKRLQSGKTKTVQKHTLTKYPWSEDEKAFLKQYIPKKDDVRQRIINNPPPRRRMDDIDSDSDDEPAYIPEPTPARERSREPTPEPEVVELEEELDYETLLHCDAVANYMNTRSNYKPNRISAPQSIAQQTRTQDKSNAKTLCKIYQTEDFREILKDDPQTFYNKVANYKIPNGKAKGQSYSAATRVKKIAVIFTLLNEYEPAISYVKNKTTHDFKEYYQALEKISTQNARTSQSDTLKKRLANITAHEEILNDLKQLYNLENSLKATSQESLEDNLNYIIILMFTYGCFDKTIDPDNVAFIPRLSIDKISINNTRSNKVEGDAKMYHRRTGRLYIKGEDALKTGRRYSFDYNVPKYVKQQLSLSINTFPREMLLGDWSTEKIGKQLSKVIRANTTMKADTNTKLRHLYETVFKVLEVNDLTISSALAHDPFTGDVIYTDRLIDEYNDEKRQTIVDFFDKLADKKN